MQSTNQTNKTFEVVNQFEHHGKLCVVVRVSLPYFSTFFHNGYVESEFNLYGNVCAEEEITFFGTLKSMGIDERKSFLGFDTAHSYNFDEPETQTAEYVEGKCREIVEVLEGKDAIRTDE